jgi:thiamine pyrophosphate-dependent acetolactate synthase large subunit-like protein
MKSRGLGYLLVTNEFSASTMADGYARATVAPRSCGPGRRTLTGIGEALARQRPLLCIVTDVNRDPSPAFQVDLPSALLQPVTRRSFASAMSVNLT